MTKKKKNFFLFFLALKAFFEASKRNCLGTFYKDERNKCIELVLILQLQLQYYMWSSSTISVTLEKCGASFIKCYIETVQHLILQSFLKCAYVWFGERTYTQKHCIRLSFRCELYKSWMILQLKGFRSLLVNATKLMSLTFIRAPFNI